MSTVVEQNNAEEGGGLFQFAGTARINLIHVKVHANSATATGGGSKPDHHTPI